MPAPAGPAVTIQPVCPVFTVDSVYAVGPATEATEAQSDRREGQLTAQPGREDQAERADQTADEDQPLQPRR